MVRTDDFCLPNFHLVAFRVAIIFFYKQQVNVLGSIFLLQAIVVLAVIMAVLIQNVYVRRRPRGRRGQVIKLSNPLKLLLPGKIH